MEPLCQRAVSSTNREIAPSPPPRHQQCPHLFLSPLISSCNFPRSLKQKLLITNHKQLQELSPMAYIPTYYLFTKFQKSFTQNQIKLLSANGKQKLLNYQTYALIRISITSHHSWPPFHLRNKTTPQKLKPNCSSHMRPHMCRGWHATIHQVYFTHFCKPAIHSEVN